MSKDLLPVSPVALEAATAQSPVDLWHLPPEEPVLATPHPGRAAVTLGDTGSSPQPALAPTAETYKPDLKNLHKLQPVGGLCGNTFCQPVPVTAGFRHSLQARQQAQKKFPFSAPSTAIGRSWRESKCLQDLCFASPATPLPHRDDSLLRTGRRGGSRDKDGIISGSAQASPQWGQTPRSTLDPPQPQHSGGAASGAMPW